MNPDLKDKCDRISEELFSAMNRLQSLRPQLSRGDDIRALDSIATDLAWAVENCTVIGNHQVGQSLDDNMGYPD